ncbi:hypothetical protein [Acinetobacter sp. YH12106]|uniref:hypothetical protein n=1 Tax=Acinetobacter sp. YH12106 TaxID=2601094 RepID=UPI00211EB54E|nr:hypothetical protein [Acinetobacter sp. YH12106]
MSDFEKYIEAKYPNRSPKILFQKFKDIDGTLFYGIKEVEDQAEAWNHQQAIIDEHTEVIKLQDADLRKHEKQIESLKAQLNNMERCYIEKKKQVEVCAALAVGWNEITWDKTTHWTEGYEEGCYHCSAQIEEALRGES